MDPKRYHHGDLKRTLLKVADRELAENGLQHLSLREIAKKAGVSHTAPYKHFRDKDELLKEMVTLEYKNIVLFSEEVEWRYPDNIEMQFQAFAEKILNLAETSPRKLNLMLSATSNEELSNEIAKFHTAIQENLLRLAQSETPRTARVVTNFWYGLVGAALLYSQKRIAQGTTVEAIAEQLVSTLAF